MNHTITTTLSSDIYDYLLKEAQECNQSKKSIIESALKMYKKEKLRQAVEKGLKERLVEYKTIATEFHSTQLASITSNL